MNAAQAKAALKKLYGDKAVWRYDENAPLADERDTVRSQLPTLKSAVEQLKAAMEARRAELLSDPEYVRLVSDYQAARKAREQAGSMSRHYRVMVGRSVGIGYEVKGEGDNWDEAIASAKSHATP